MDSQALERSALESKDREELHTIAVALGGKPGSRARKGDMVDLILELAGVTSAPAALAPTEPAAAADEVAEADAETASNRPGRRTRTSASTAAPDASAQPDVVPTPADVLDDVSDAPAHGETPPTERQGGRDRQPQRDRQQGGNERQQAGSDRPASGDRPPSGDRPGGEGDDGESGNRRRRRRGRDRDRDRPADENVAPEELIEVSGLLDLRDDGYGFLRLKNYLPSKDDVYVSVKQVRQFGLRKGDHLTGASRAASRNEKNPALLRIDTVNGQDPESMRDRRNFDDLTPLYPDERLRLEQRDSQVDTAARIIDLIAPIGKGQRGLIVSPPKAGKTTVMKQIARAIEVNHPEVELLVLLIDERPEEVTDFTRWLRRGQVVSSTFDRPADEHTMVAELAIERAKRLVEEGKDVVVILDGITRLARAYNLAAPPTGRVMSGGIDTGALYPPKKFFGAARNVEEGGSLTILATALVETGSKMDEVIFEEFKGTGNMELKLDRKMAERRVFPAIDVDASSTRHEELLFDAKQLKMVWTLRRVLSGLAGDGAPGAGLEMLIDRIVTYKSNDEFLAEFAKANKG